MQDNLDLIINPDKRELIKKNRNKTHFVFIEGKVFTSENLVDMLPFLMGVEKEVNTILSFGDKLNDIRSLYISLLDSIRELVEDSSKSYKLKNFLEINDKYVQALSFDKPVRSEMIVLFAHLEVQFCLWVSYKYGLSNKEDIKNKVSRDDEELKNFIKDFCLSKDNKWVVDNKKRAGRISHKQLRGLRNSLTHFFSVDKSLAITFDSNHPDNEELEKKLGHKTKFISPKDLFEIIRGVGKIMMSRWSDDSLKSLENRDTSFEKKIFCVKNLIKEQGSIFIKKGNN